jgi:hypothetical protein
LRDNLFWFIDEVEKDLDNKKITEEERTELLELAILEETQYVKLRENS